MDTDALPDRKITRNDIESKFRELQGDVDHAADERISYAVVAGVAVSFSIVAVAFWLGKRRGRRKNAVIEVRRI